LFGCVPGSANTFGAVYKVFGDIVKTQYPDIVPSYPAVDQILDTSYLLAVAKKANFNPESNLVKPPTSTGKPGAVIAKRNWKIEFQTGRASFSGSATQTLEALLRDLLVAGNTTVEIGGHTDSVGNADANLKLSEARAFAVRDWLVNRAPKNFEGRLQVKAYGQTSPIASDSTESGRSANRRVEIKISSVN
jgi:outer membrane protein OmpA-like peptidoglycan-associated protein